MSELRAGVQWTSLSAAISAIAKLGQVVILTRFVTKDEFGLIAIALMCISFSDIFLDLGISSGVMHIKNITKKQYSSLFWLNVFMGIVIYLILYFITPFIAEYYNDRRLNEILPIIFFTVILSSLFRLQRTIQQKNMNFTFISIVEILSSVLMLFVSILLVFYHYGIYSLIYSTVFYSVFLAIVYLGYSLWKEKNIEFYFSLKDITPFFKIGFYQTAGSVLDTLCRELDTILISSAFSLDVLGVYSLCKQLAMRIYSFINPIILKVLTPFLSQIQDDLKLVKDKYVKMLSMLSLINYPIYFFIIYFSSDILLLLYGAQFDGYGVILAILSLNYALLSIASPIGALEVALGRTDLGFYWAIYRVVSYAIALLIGINFNIYVCVTCLLVVNVLNLYPANKMLLEKMIDLGFVEYIKIQLFPVKYSVVLFPVIVVFIFIDINIILKLLMAVVFYSIGYIFIIKILKKEEFALMLSLFNFPKWCMFK